VALSVNTDGMFTCVCVRDVNSKGPANRPYSTPWQDAWRLLPVTWRSTVSQSVAGYGVKCRTCFKNTSSIRCWVYAKRWRFVIHWWVVRVNSCVLNWKSGADLVNLGPLTTKFSCLISTHPRSPLRVLCRLMRLHSGHMTLLEAEFQPPKLSPQSDLLPRAAASWALR